METTYARRGVFAGGNVTDGNSDIYQTFVDLVHKVSSDPLLLICTGASAEADIDRNAKILYDLYTGTYGVKKAAFLHIDFKHPLGAHDQANVDLIASAHGLYFGGGEQIRLHNLFLQTTPKGKVDTPAMAKIREMYESGKLVVGGTSAGAMVMQATPMVNGPGLSWEAFLTDPRPYIDSNFPNDLSFQEGGGLGLFPFGFVDAHVGAKGRQGRDIRLVHFFPEGHSKLGFGIDEETAVVLDGDTFEVVGYKGVFIYDISEAFSDGTRSKYWNLANVKVSFLTHGDRYDFRANKVTFASWKKEISGNERHDTPTSPTHDIFSCTAPDIFTSVTTNFVDSKSAKTYGLTHQKTPEFRVDFEKKEDSKGAIGTKGTKEFISYNNLYVSIYAVDTNQAEKIEFKDENKQE